jgi:regulator of protease activity HflC (stomatin/prohibitin superfamily)
MSWLAVSIAVVVVFLFFGVRIVRPIERGLVERLGKYRRLAVPGFNWVIPFVDTMYRVNITEMMVDAQPQEIITNDNLNARVDAQVYFKVKDDEESVKSSQYRVFDYKYQIVNLARTTLRNIIGTLSLKSANSERGKINTELQKTLRDETSHWGIEIVRTELKEIDPPKDVQETMNKVVKAENEKVAAIDFATATETMADGARRAEIKKADGVKQGKVLEAEGEAQAIKLVHEAANQYFVGNAQLLRRLQTVEKALATNSKIVIPAGSELVNVIGELAGVLPLKSGPAPAVVVGGRG